MKKFLSFFYTDIHWKLIALFLAFLLWVVGANVNNPHENGSVNVPLNRLNFEILANEGIVLLNESALDIRVNVGVSAARHYLSDLLGADPAIQEEQVIPSVDFRVIDIDAVRNSDGPVTVRLDISTNFYEGLYHRSTRPRYVELVLDQLVHQMFPIEAVVLSEAAPNFELRPERLENSRVTVTGARSVISEIDMVCVFVGGAILHLHADHNESVALTVFDHAGRDITDLVELSVRETFATIPVWPVDELELYIQSIGETAANFAVAEIEVYPRVINIIAPEERLIQLTPLLLEVDITGANVTAYHIMSVVEHLPVGVYLAHGQSPYVTVTVEIEPIERRIISVPFDNIRARGMGLQYQVLSEMTAIRIAVSGPRSSVSELGAADIGLELDLRNLPIGIHNVEMSVDLPYGITLAQARPSLRVQIDEPAADEPDDYDHYQVDNAEPLTPVMPSDYVPAADENDPVYDENDENDTGNEYDENDEIDENDTP